jgi:hypothetical protein
VVLPTTYRIEKLEERPGPNKECRTIIITITTITTIIIIITTTTPITTILNNC